MDIVDGEGLDAGLRPHGSALLRISHHFIRGRGAVARAVARDAVARAESQRLASLSARHAALSPREREVCAMVARGLLNKEIAAKLGISEAMVKMHRAKAMDRLGVGSSAELVSFWERLRGGG